MLLFANYAPGGGIYIVKERENGATVCETAVTAEQQYKETGSLEFVEIYSLQLVENIWFAIGQHRIMQLVETYFLKRDILRFVEYEFMDRLNVRRGGQGGPPTQF